MKNKKGQAINTLIMIGWALITFGIIIGLGTIVLQKFGDNIVTCPGTLEGTETWNETLQLCSNGTDTVAGTGSGYSVISYVGTQMGSSGLAGWIPLIIVVVVAGLIFTYFGMKGKAY